MKTATTIAMTLMATCVALTIPGIAGAVILGQLDDFEDGTTQAWEEGFVSPNPPVNVSDGGPTGLGDNYLELVSSGGLGAGSRQVAFNLLQWTGDYVGGGVTAIEADMANFGASAVSLRIALQDGSGTRFGSTVSVSLPADGVWHPVSFGVKPADLTSIIGAASAEAALSNVIQFRIMVAAVGPAWEGDVIVSTLGVDNINAVTDLPQVPSLSGWGFAVLGAGLLLVAVRSGPLV